MVRIPALDRKLLRDLWGMRGQALAIAFVIVAGVSTYVSMRSVFDTLERTLADYYAEYRFGDGFATVRRAPELLAGRLRAIPGVGQLETRVTSPANLEVAGFDEPIGGLLVSIPEGRQPLLNRLYLRQGRLVEAGREDEVLLNEPFAEAHGLVPGDELTAIVNGRRRSLTVVGIALSPEFLMQIQPGSMVPDPERYGVLWMGRAALAAAAEMEGAFNDLSFTLARGASIDEVIARMEAQLDRYGGRGAYGRSDQPSHMLINEEFRQLRGLATLLPSIFLGVAAFLLNIVVARLISLQREQIAVLKAFGYTNLGVGVHYLKLVLLIALIGAAGGTATGIWTGGAMGGMYLEYYRFPALEYTLYPSVVVTAVALTLFAALLGVVFAVRRVVRLPPAEAMRPAPPALYRPTFVERLGLQRLFDQPTRMILRNLERQPLKALLSIVGIASSCAILIMGLFFSDSFDFIIDTQYGLAQREDLTVAFAGPTSMAAIGELRALPGVQVAEPFRSIPVRLHHEHRSYETAIEGVPESAYLRSVLDTELRRITIPPEGIVLTERLGEILRAAPGDSIVVEVLEGSRRSRSVPVAALTRQFIGVAAYMDLAAANRVVGGGQAISGAFLMTDERYEDDLVERLQERPGVVGITAQERAIQAFMDTAAASMLVFTFILSLFAGVIAFGVIYNSARISLSERERELASLRVLGFRRGEIAYILLGELAILVLAAIPLGFLLGALGSAGTVAGLETDMYQIPVVLGRGTFAIAALVVLTAAAASALIVNYRLNRLDLVGVLKTRE